LTLPLPALLLALALAPRGSVDLEGAHRFAMVPPKPPPPAAPHAAARAVTISRVEGGVRVRARWRLETGAPGWYADTLLGPGAHVERVAIGGLRATGAGSDAGTLAIARVETSSTIELDAFVPGDPTREPLALALAPAVRGTIELVGLAGVRVELGDGKAAPRRAGLVFAGQGALVLAPAPNVPKDDGAPVVVGKVGLGVTVGDAEVRTHARLRWEVRRGQLSTVALVATGAGDDLEVTGARMRKHERSGDRIVVELDGAESGSVELELRWSKPTPKGEAVLELPRIELEGVTRSELAVEIARDGDVDVVPDCSGWTATAPQAMPGWARDLILGSATAAFRAQGDAAPGKLALLHFVPVAGPPAVIQRADVQIAATAEGRALVHVRWEIANERKPNLRVVLPPGAQLLAIEAAGRDVRPAKEGDAWLVPVPRSLETVEGLLSVPVVVAFLLEDPPWARHERRELELPSVDVPISKVAVTMRLPRGYRSRMKVGDYGVDANLRIERDKPRRVQRGRGAKGKRKAPQGTSAAGPAAVALPPDNDGDGLADGTDELERSTADRILRDAQDAYQRNEFEEAQGKLDELRQRGIEDENAARLQSNLDVLEAEDPMPAPDAAASEKSVAFGATAVDAKKATLVRRVREQAKARSGKKVSEQRDRRDRAKRLRSEGKFKEAAQEYRKALEVNKQLKKLEQDESKVYDFAEDEIEGELEQVETEAAAAESMQSSSKLVDPSWLSVSPDEAAEHGFGVEILALPLPTRTPVLADVPPALDDGPRVLVPTTTGGDTIIYGFDLWAEGTRHAVVVRARRRLELPPR
jgi:hypothetical protein